MQMRPLTPNEIDRLEAQGCSAESWNTIRVSERFSPEYIRNVSFSGEIGLGVFEKVFTLPGGIKKHSGLFHATLHNCSIGDNSLIERTTGYIANYHIGTECRIQHIDRLWTEGESSFGNGAVASVVNEGGGREVPLFDRLSAPLAHLIAQYRHRPLFIEQIGRRIAEYAESRKSTVGNVGDRAVIIGTGALCNINIGTECRIEGASRLQNGTILSHADAPTYIGSHVTADDFIIGAGSYISDGASLARCFIGQACRLSHQFTAHDTLCFANCVFENGEACALFAGPYTVSMHKSTLLIACSCSFLNAGSGSNQSNHMYKLGPIHQGRLDRGCKLASNSYLSWPAHVGSFSLVMGRHTSHPDVALFPFSYLMEQGEKTVLIPGTNLMKAGTLRDAQKWESRDRRPANDRTDPIDYRLLSPYTVGKMVDAIEWLEKELNTGNGEAAILYGSTSIPRRAAQNGIAYYRLAIDKFMGDNLTERLEQLTLSDTRHPLASLFPRHTSSGNGKWCDLSGLLAPGPAVEQLLQAIEHDENFSLDDIAATFSQIAATTRELTWEWICGTILPRYYGINAEEVTTGLLHEWISRWMNAVSAFNEAVKHDAEKEFSDFNRIGYGIDGDRTVRTGDFEQVHGTAENHPFLQNCDKQTCRQLETGRRLIDQLDCLQ